MDISGDPSQISIGDNSSIQKAPKPKSKKKKKKGKKSTANMEYEFSADKGSSKQLNTYGNEYQTPVNESAPVRTDDVIHEVEEDFSYPGPNQDQ